VHSGQDLRRGVKPWWRRLYLSLNYMPVLFGGVLLWLAALTTANITNPVVAAA
jgi:hypothetical protein